MVVKVSNIPNRLKNPSKEHPYVAGAVDIYDDTLGKPQSQVNQESIEDIATETQRAQNKENLLQSEINALEGSNFVTVDTYSDLPEEGSVDTIYRVCNWDGSANDGEGAVDGTVYSQYAWDSTNSEYKLLCVRTQIGEVFDISLWNAVGGVLATYDDLADALGTNGANVPAGIRKGGMSVKFVQSSDNKYVRFFLMKNEWSTNVADWQGVDKEPIDGSPNIVESGGVELKINNRLFYEFNLYQGVIEDNWSYDSSPQDRVTTKEIHVKPNDIYVRWDIEKYKIFIRMYDGTNTTNTGWLLSGGEYTVSGKEKIGILIGAKDGSNINPSGVATDINLKIVPKNGFVETLKKDIEILKKDIEILNEGFGVSDFYQGSINAQSGNIVTDSTRITTGVFLHETDVTVTVPKGIKAILMHGDSLPLTDSGVVISDGGTYTVQSGTGYKAIGLIFGFVDNSAITPSESKRIFVGRGTQLYEYLQGNVENLEHNTNENSNEIDIIKVQYFGISAFYQGQINPNNGAVVADSTRITTGVLYPSNELIVTIPQKAKAILMHGDTYPLTDSGVILPNGGTTTIPSGIGYKMVVLIFGYVDNSAITPNGGKDFFVGIKSQLSSFLSDAVGTVTKNVQNNGVWGLLMNRWNEDTKLENMCVLPNESVMIPNKCCAFGCWNIVNGVAVADTSNTDHTYLEIDTFSGDYNVVHFCYRATEVYSVIFTDSQYNVIGKDYLGRAGWDIVDARLVTPYGASKLLISSRFHSTYQASTEIAWYKVDNRWELNNRILNAPAVNDCLHEKSPSSQNTILDDESFLCCSFYSASPSWGEGVSENRLSIYPLNQPTNYFIKRVPSDYVAYDVNGLAIGNNVFRVIGNKKNNQGEYCYIDYDFDNDTFGNILPFKFNDENMTDAVLVDYITSKGYTFGSMGYKLVFSASVKGKTNDSIKYLTLTFTNQYSIMCYTLDNCENIYPIDVIPARIDSESTFVVLNNKIYALARQDENVAEKRCILFFTADYDATNHTCSNWSEGIEIEYSTNSRPAMEIYKGKLLILIECLLSRPFATEITIWGNRRGFRLLYGLGENPNLFDVILDTYVKWSTTEQSIVINKDSDIFIAYQASRNNYTATGRGELIFARLGEYTDK